MVFTINKSDILYRTMVKINFNKYLFGILGWVIGIAIFIFIVKSPEAMLGTAFMILGHYILSRSG